MYKNFKITKKEKQQILEMHKKHGYKKPMNEGDYDEMLDIQHKLTNTDDGPIDEFTVILRIIEIARNTEVDSEKLANYGLKAFEEVQKNKNDEGTYGVGPEGY